MPGSVFDLCYLLALFALSPVLLWRSWRTGRYRQGWEAKFRGQLPIRESDTKRRVWFHAVSVGEVLQLRQIVAEFLRQHPEADLLITTTTDTGFSVAQENFAEHDVAYFPLDFSWSVRAALRRVQPDLIVLVELELWPNFIREAARRGCPLALVNGRLSARSFRGYRWIRMLVTKLLAKFAVIAVQTDEYAARFLDLGAAPESVVTTGSVKFDGVQTDRQNERTRSLREWFQIPEGAVVLVAGSTHAPEERYVIEDYHALRRILPDARLIIAPRHPERGDALAEMIRAGGDHVLQRSRVQESRSSASAPAGRPSVGLLDTVGELGACWGLADIAFVGGSFTDRGGQNMIEPAAYGAAVCFGPNTGNFRQTVELLLTHDAARRVHSPVELRDFVLGMSTSFEERQRMGNAARKLALSQQGATRKTVDCLSRILTDD